MFVSSRLCLSLSMNFLVGIMSLLPYACFSNLCFGLLPGTRFQDTRNPDEKKDVVAEYEDKADRSCDNRGVDLNHSFVSLWWIQMPLTACVCID